MYINLNRDRGAQVKTYPMLNCFNDTQKGGSSR